MSIGCSIELVVSSITTKGQQDLLLGLSLAVVDILLELRALHVKKVVLWVVDTIVTGARVVSIPTLVSKVLGYQSVRKVREDVDESNGDDIDSRRITEMGQTLLVWSLSIVHCHVRLGSRVVVGRD